MSYFYKIIFFLALSIGLNHNANAFDLKSLTDKIQKDMGGKLKAPSSGGSNSLGGMLKGLNQNKGNASTNIMQGKSSNTSGNKKLAKGICEPNIPQTIKNLPKGNTSILEKDFSKSQNEIIKILKTIPQSSNDPYVSSLTTFEGAFETKEIETLFNNFIRKKKY